MNPANTKHYANALSSPCADALDFGLRSEPVLTGEDYRAIFDAVNDAIVIRDVKTYHILAANSKLCELFGCTLEEMRRRPPASLSSGIPPYTTARALIHIRAAEEGEPQLYDWLVRDAAGQPFWVEINLRRTMIGGRDCLLTVMRDIDKRKRAEEAFRAAQRSLATLLGNLPGVAYRCRDDEERTAEYISEGSRALFGCEPSDLVNNAKRSLQQLIQPEDRDRVRGEIREALARSAAFCIEYRIRTADGREKWVWEQGVGAKSSDDRATHVEGFITDITDRRLMEQWLQSEATT